MFGLEINESINIPEIYGTKEVIIAPIILASVRKNILIFSFFMYFLIKISPSYLIIK